MFWKKTVLLGVSLAALCGGPAGAQMQASGAPVAEISHADKLSLARDFLARMKSGYAKAEGSLEKAGFAGPGDKAHGLSEGEDLLFRIRLPERIGIDTPLLGRVYDGRVTLSLRDFVQVLDFAIEYDPAARTAAGWYIRENKLFALDMQSRAVSTDHGTFQLSPTVREEDEDVFVPVEELQQWFDFDLAIDAARLDILLTSAVKLPIQERLARERHRGADGRVGQPELPLLVETPKLLDVPMIDVATSSRYVNPGAKGADTQNQHRATVRTAGDFMGGTLTTQSQLEREEKLTSVRVNYKQESLEPELLGPLQARRFEIGDVNSVNQPLDTLRSLGTGVRVTNVHPLRSFLRPTTEITGDSFPGWDVELYRNDQLLSTQRVGDDGIYRFSDVDLYSSDNNFRVIFYGPQGEQREEEIYVPVDSTRLSEMGSAYDISVSRQNETTYVKDKQSNEDDGAPNISAQYEMPVGDVSALNVGIESGSRDGDQRFVAHAGASSVLAETLLNLNTAVENNGEMAAELVARRNFGDHQFRNTVLTQTENFGVSDDAQGLEILTNQLSLTGPLGIDFGTRKPYYNFDTRYALDADGNNSFDTTGGISGAFQRVSVNQQFTHSTSDKLSDDLLHSITTLSGSMGRNRLRLQADYEITPDSNLDYVLANVRRYVDEDMELDLTLTHRTDPRLTEGKAQVNWWAGVAHISPAISYNSDNDLALTLNTRFGLTKDPLNGEIRMFDRSITGNGGISAFVFLDANGDGQFNEGEEPLPEVVIRAPQNSGREVTGEDGYAFFNRLAHMRVTDVFIDEGSLKDPFWIPGFKGTSVLPREGHVTSLQFPILLSGEMDGTVYARTPDGTQRPLRGIFLGLYDHAGNQVQRTVSEADGFYLFSKIPPGDYYLNIDSKHLGQEFARPAPQPITIGYDGTIIYANNIFLEEGQADVGYSILANAASISPDPAKLEGKVYVLNLGSYSSRVMMGLAWYKMKTLYGAMLKGTELLERPSESFVDKAGEHVLRVILKSNRMDDAQRRCRDIAARGGACTVEILPGGLPQQVLATPAGSQG